MVRGVLPSPAIQCPAPGREDEPGEARRLQREQPAEDRAVGVGRRRSRAVSASSATPYPHWTRKAPVKVPRLRAVLARPASSGGKRLVKSA